KQKFSNSLSLQNALLYSFQEEITSKIIISCWKKCLSKVRDYWETIEHGLDNKSDNSDGEILDTSDSD
ncbi:8747_t:CDS:1, partial [Gigaspora margarita]